MLKKFLMLACTSAILLTATNSQAQTVFSNNFQLQPYKFQMNGVWIDSCDAYVVRCKEWITLRDRASVYGDSLAHIPLGARVRYYGDISGTDFCEVSYGKMRGYVMRYYIDLVEY